MTFAHPPITMRRASPPFTIPPCSATLETAWSEWSANGLDRATIVPDTLQLPAYRDGMGAATEPA